MTVKPLSFKNTLSVPHQPLLLPKVVRRDFLRPIIKYTRKFFFWMTLFNVCLTHCQLPLHGHNESLRIIYIRRVLLFDEFESRDILNN